MQKVYILFIVNDVMSKAMSVLVLGMMLLLVGFVSAGEDEFKDTKVAGVIYNANTGALIADANVTVDCNGINKITTSDANGQYSVIYYNSFYYIFSSL